MNFEHPLPLRTGTDAQRAAVLDLFARVSFTETTLLERLRMRDVGEGDTPGFRWFRDEIDPDDPFGVVARLFVTGQRVAVAPCVASVGDAAFHAMRDLDLLREDARGDHAGTVFSPVQLVPIALPAGGEVLVACDREELPGEGDFTRFTDIVFSGHNALTREFVALLPRVIDGGAALDVGTGSGVTAVALARAGASPVVAVDLTARAIHFARFNAWMNGAAIEFAQGDLYAPVAGRRFRLVVSHPPYVPTLGPTAVFRDGGGELGETLVQRVVAGLPDHLEVGGTFVLLSLAMDLQGRPFERRAQEWLGAGAAAFDLVFAIENVKDRETFARYIVDRALEPSAALLRRWREVLARHEVEYVGYGALVGRRLGEDVGVTRRVKMPERGASYDRFASLLDWLAWVRRTDTHAVLDLYPTLVEGTQLEVRHTAGRGGLVPDLFELVGGAPFPTRVKTEAWVAALLDRCDGGHTVRELVGEAASRGQLPADFGEPDALRLVGFLAERGFVRLGGGPA